MRSGKRAVKNVVSAFFRPATDRPRRKVPDQRTHPRRVQRRTQHVKVVGPDGKAVEELRLFGNLMHNPFGRAWSGSEFTFVHTDPGKDEPILVVNPDETAGTMFVAKGDEPDPISVTLQPAATVTGRLVDEKGSVRAGQTSGRVEGGIVRDPRPALARREGEAPSEPPFQARTEPHPPDSFKKLASLNLARRAFPTE
jgi:hypothetical protein